MVVYVRVLCRDLFVDVDEQIAAWVGEHFAAAQDYGWAPNRGDVLRLLRYYVGDIDEGEYDRLSLESTRDAMTHARRITAPPGDLRGDEQAWLLGHITLAELLRRIRHHYVAE